jgi:hypothetical protein
LEVTLELSDVDDYLVEIKQFFLHDRHFLVDQNGKPLWASVLGSPSWKRLLPTWKDGNQANMTRENLQPPALNRYFNGYDYATISTHPDRFPVVSCGLEHFVLLNETHRQLVQEYIDRKGGRLMVNAGYVGHGYSQFTPETPFTYLTTLLTLLDEVRPGLSYAYVNSGMRWDMRAPTNLTLRTDRKRLLVAP